MPKRYGPVKSRRLPDTYDVEAMTAVPPQGGRSIVNPEQFLFLGETEHLRPTGDPKTPRRLNELKFMGDTAQFLQLGEYQGQIRAERYRG